MRVMRSSGYRRRNPRRKRAVTTHAFCFSKLNRFEEFEDINLVDAEKSDHLMRHAFEQDSEVSSAASPRGAFDIVSEYLSHSNHHEKTGISANKTTDLTSRISKKTVLCNLSDEVDSEIALYENPHSISTVSGKGRVSLRSRKRPAARRRSSSRSNLNCGINSYLVFKRVKPLSEVNTNILNPGQSESDRVPISAISTSTVQSCPPLLSPKSDSTISMPFLKTLLTSDHDARSPSPLGTSSDSKVPIKNVSRKDEDNECDNCTDTVTDDVKEKTSPDATICLDSDENTTPKTVRAASLPTVDTAVESTITQPEPTDSAQESNCVLSDVHTLIQCTALAGSELVENHGLANPSVISHISSTVLPPSGSLVPTQLDPKRIVSKATGRRRLSARSRPRPSNESAAKLSKYASTVPNNGTTIVQTPTRTKPLATRHPFMHFWESDDDCISVSRGWQTRRSKYLALLLSCTDVVDDVVAPDMLGSGRNPRRRSSDHLGQLILHGLGKGSTGAYARHLLEDKPSLAAERTTQNQKMLSGLEPTVLGYRWPITPTATSAEVDREVMLLWN